MADTSTRVMNNSKDYIGLKSLSSSSIPRPLPSFTGIDAIKSKVDSARSRYTDWAIEMPVSSANLKEKIYRDNITYNQQKGIRIKNKKRFGNIERNLF